jgi:hypothetical protein
MKRFVLAGVLVAAACGTATDDRPLTLEYITRAILAPSCATAECHSAFRAQVGDVFDTPEATQRSIVANHLVRYPIEIEDPENTLLIRVLTVGAPSLLDPSSGNVRMPYDTPLPDADIELITAWIAAGIPGAQCTPNEFGRGCQVRVETILGETRFVNEVVECPDGNVGQRIQTCGENQVCDYYEGNGQCVSQ